MALSSMSFMKSKCWKKPKLRSRKSLKQRFPEVCVGAFEKCKSFYVIGTRAQDQQLCCCCAHIEIRMLFKACMVFRRNLLKGKDETERYPVYENLSGVINKTVCNKGDTLYHHLACTNRQCENCRVKKVKLMAQEEDASQSVLDMKWEQFECFHCD